MVRANSFIKKKRRPTYEYAENRIRFLEKVTFIAENRQNAHCIDYGEIHHKCLQYLYILLRKRRGKKRRNALRRMTG